MVLVRAVHHRDHHVLLCTGRGGSRFALVAERGGLGWRHITGIATDGALEAGLAGQAVGGAGCWRGRLLAGQAAGPCGLEASAAAPWLAAADARTIHLLRIVAGELAELPHLALGLIHRMATNAWSCGFVGVWVHAACTRSAALWKSVAGLGRSRTAATGLAGLAAGQCQHIRSAQHTAAH